MDRVYISRPPAEWALIEQNLRKVSKLNLGAFVNNRLSLLCKEFEEEPWKFCEFIPDSVQKTIYIRNSEYKSLSIIGVMNGKDGFSESAVINRLIIEPLLLR